LRAQSYVVGAEIVNQAVKRVTEVEQAVTEHQVAGGNSRQGTGGCTDLCAVNVDGQAAEAIMYQGYVVRLAIVDGRVEPARRHRSAAANASEYCLQARAGHRDLRTAQRRGLIIAYRPKYAAGTCRGDPAFQGEGARPEGEV